MMLLVALSAASPAWAAEGAFFSLSNTDFVVLIAFLLFIGVLVYYKVPGLVGRKLDERAEGIKSDLDEARAIREEAQSLLTSFERKQKDVQAQADRIVSQARDEANEAAKEAKEDIGKSVERRMKAAEDQLASAEARAVRDIRDQAVSVAVAAARDVIAKQMTTEDRNASIDAAIDEVETKLH
jgi:F-type H+-transporting ATPase subunit b